MLLNIHNFNSKFSLLITTFLNPPHFPILGEVLPSHNSQFYALSKYLISIYFDQQISNISLQFLEIPKIPFNSQNSQNSIMHCPSHITYVTRFHIFPHFPSTILIFENKYSDFVTFFINTIFTHLWKLWKTQMLRFSISIIPPTSESKFSDLSHFLSTILAF